MHFLPPPADKIGIVDAVEIDLDVQGSTTKLTIVKPVLSALVLLLPCG